MATIYEVSKAAGVSLATVSRVVNGNVKVSERTKAKVLKAMEELGYRPNAIAQSLASNRTNSVGLLVSELHGSFFADMMSTIERVLRQAGKHVIITAGHSDEEKERNAIEFLKSRRCDALILHAEAVSDEYLQTLHQSGTPVVIVNRDVPDLKNQCFVMDNELGGYLATKAMIESGHKDIGYISGPLFKTDAKARLAGHQKALKEAGLTQHPNAFFEGEYHETDGMAAVSQFIKAGVPVTAVVCANDEMASGAMEAARQHGLSIPEDLSIIGFDDVLFARYLFPKLTTIDNPIKEMGEMAALWVLKHVYKSTVNRPIVNYFEPKLITRDSIGQAQ